MLLQIVVVAVEIGETGQIFKAIHKRKILSHNQSRKDGPVLFEIVKVVLCLIVKSFSKGKPRAIWGRKAKGLLKKRKPGCRKRER